MDMPYSKSELKKMINLPDPIRRTYQLMLELGSASAKEVSERTGRARAYESLRLNQLVLLGLLTKRRDGRKVIFMKEEARRT